MAKNKKEGRTLLKKLKIILQKFHQMPICGLHLAQWVSH
jgi:hypothetical protein